MSSCATAKPHASAAWVRCSVPSRRRPCGNKPVEYGAGCILTGAHDHTVPHKHMSQEQLSPHVAIALGGAQHDRELWGLSQSPHTLAGGAIGWLCECCLCGCGGLRQGAPDILIACSRRIWRRYIIGRSRPVHRRLDTVAGSKAAQQPSSKRCQLRAGSCCVSCGCRLVRCSAEAMCLVFGVWYDEHKPIWRQQMLRMQPALDQARLQT